MACKFTPYFADIVSPLRDHLKGNSDYHWKSQRNNAFHKMKQYIANPGTIAYYNTSKDRLMCPE